MASAAHEYAEYLADILSPLGSIHWRAMFGGYGFYCGDVFFALAADEVLYFKADRESRAQFEAAGLPPFVYYKQGRPMSLSYYQAPELIFEDDEALRLWGGLALAAARRAKPSAPKAARKTASRKPV